MVYTIKCRVECVAPSDAAAFRQAGESSQGLMTGVGLKPTTAGDPQPGVHCLFHAARQMSKQGRYRVAAGPAAQLMPLTARAQPAPRGGRGSSQAPVSECES